MIMASRTRKTRSRTGQLHATRERTIAQAEAGLDEAQKQLLRVMAEIARNLADRGIVVMPRLRQPGWPEPPTICLTVTREQYTGSTVPPRSA